MAGTMNPVRDLPTPRRKDRRTLDDQDAVRFAWWFSAEGKEAFLTEYLRGVREGWSLDQWRAAIDKAMQQQDEDTDNA